MADLLHLGRAGRCDELAQQGDARRRQRSWNAVSALELACAWLLAGDPAQADLAYVEADLLDPSLALVPDVWGLWPPPEPTAAGSAKREAALNLAERFRDWRRPDPQVLWHTVLAELKTDWHLVLEPELGDALLILGHATAAEAAPPLDPPLEPELVRLVADAEIAAEPAASNRYWQLVASIRPQWDLARIRAADLALARGDLETSAHWLSQPPPETLANPWFHDVAARHAVARGAVVDALDAWGSAIAAAGTTADAASLVEIFEQRSREARRGPGVLQVRSLANRGDTDAARDLLDRLLAADPQWQPLRSLREQLRTGAESAPAAEPSAHAGRAGADDGAEAFQQLLDRAASRLTQMGQPITFPIPAPAPESPEAALGEVDGILRRLDDYAARFALA